MHSSSTDPTGTFNTWFTARTEQANRQIAWSPERRLYADYLRTLPQIDAAARPLTAEAFAGQLAARHAKTLPMMVREDEHATAEALEPCWDRALIRSLLAHAA